MPEEFVDRLREAILDPGGVDVAGLRGAATNAGADLTRNRALALIRLAHNQPVSQDVEHEVRERLNAQAPVVADRGESQLVATLACEALIVNFAPTRQRYVRPLLAALATRCAAYAGWRPVHPDLSAYANAYLSLRSQLVHQYPPGLAPVKRPPDAEEGWKPTIEQQHVVLRDLVMGDRNIALERERLVWWLLSDTRPEHPLALAAELSDCIAVAPEPLPATEMLRAKLTRAVPVETVLPAVDVPADIAELCPDLTKPSADTDPDARTNLAARCLHQLMLVRVAKDTQ
jgi:hypothetical protein